MISDEKHCLMHTRVVTVLLYRNAAVANRWVYRIVKSAIDYRRGDNAVTHPFKVLTACFTRHAFRIREIRRDNRENGGILPSCILSRLTGVRVPRAYLHFGARDAARPPVLSVLLHAAVYMYHWRRRIFIEAAGTVFLVNFNEHHVNAKLVWETRRVVLPAANALIIDVARRNGLCALMPLSGTSHSRWIHGSAKLSNRFASMHEIRA